MYQILPSSLFMPFILAMFSLLSLLAFSSFSFKPKYKEFVNAPMNTKNNVLKKSILSLFVSFDPHSTLSFLWINNLNWLIMVILTLLGNLWFWSLPNRVNQIFTVFSEQLISQFSIALKSKKDSSSSLFVNLFFFLFLSNLLGLIPNVFTSTSHITLNLMFSVSLWTGFFLFGWAKFNNKMFAHLVPLSTPMPLISFMVIIESISTIIRPGTLSIRLMANMVSGHLLLTLLGNAMVNSPLLVLSILVGVQSLLMGLELGVSMIQAYVFCMLLTLYSDESEY